MSVFLEVSEAEWVASNSLAFAFRDRYPVSPGHTLVVTRRVTPDWFSATAAERAAIFELVDEVTAHLARELAPDGFNVGFNAGEVAGQTVMHLHVHVIPRFRGDMDDPRGGVRHVIPSKGNYLRAIPSLATGGASDPFAQHVLPLFDRAREIAIVAAFVQESGLTRIAKATTAALQRGARVRILTGDYLSITQADALSSMLDWERASTDRETGAEGAFEARVIEVLPPQITSFHPKSWRFEGPRFGVAFVGSSNLSRAALDHGIEWNLRVDRDRDATAYGRIRDAFEELWGRARRLDPDWIAAYARKAQQAQVPLPPGEEEAAPLEAPPEPHAVQREALRELKEARAVGRRRALVVLATGLGKTWLAAFDFEQLRAELGRRPRVLFIAHRAELLKQAAHTYRRQLRALGLVARVGWYVGDADELGAELVFASVAKLSRPEHVARLRAEAFDYVVVDEVHHAAADSYRRILACVDPRFLLGLTATPDRADAADILGLFDDFIAYRADIARGIEIGRLTPFHYVGVRDDIDYTNIPWRNRRFEPTALAAAAQTEARMATLWRAWGEHAGRRTLVFCCSVEHAMSVRGWLRGQGLRVAAVFSADGSDDREQALAQLEHGELDAVCAVDVFNEGIDVPAIDRVVMLRPTESSVVFLQQLGRGLRAYEGKTGVTVIDFVGNHRVFLQRLRALLALGGDAQASKVREALTEDGPIDLPEGCSVDLELEAKQLLSRLFHVSGADEVERAYRELVLERGADQDHTLRPTAGELYRMGYTLRPLRDRHGSWFGFVAAEGGLAAGERSALATAGAFLEDLETTAMTKCFKMVTLQVLLEADALGTGMDLPVLAAQAYAILRRSPELFDDVIDDRRAPLDDDLTRARWVRYWRENPIEAWTNARSPGRPWFRLDGDCFSLNFAVPAAELAPLVRLVRELVDLRLAEYRRRKDRAEATAEGFTCKVIWNKRDPILKLPDRKAATLPFGDTDVRMPDGAVWQFKFVKVACNVARPAGTAQNQLPDLLRSWFGPRAGQPGTAFHVRFRASPAGLWVEPVRTAASDEEERSAIAAYPDLRAAAGHTAAPAADAEGERELVILPLSKPSPDLFAVRVAGTSMDGGAEPLRDGDWAVFRVARGMPASAVEGRVVLVQVDDASFGAAYQIKRLRRDHGAWRLVSDNPEGPTFAAGEAMTPIARLERAFHPDDLAPATGSILAAEDLAAAFGIAGLEPRTDRHGGHAFVFLETQGQLVAPDRIRIDAFAPRPGETAFVLARHDAGAWRYLGVARPTDQRGVWVLS